MSLEEKIVEALRANRMALQLNALSTATGSPKHSVQCALDRLRRAGRVELRSRRFALTEKEETEADPC